VAAGGDGEGMVTGKDGLIYVALEDKNELCVFDPKTLEVKRHIRLEGIEAPTGLAVDRKHDRLFVGGHNKMAFVLNGATGNKIASFPTGSGTDAAGWDGKNQLAFISNGEGNITVIHEKSADEFVAEAPIVTQPSAKTMALYEGRVAFSGKGPYHVLPTIIEGPLVNLPGRTGCVISFETQVAAKTSVTVDGKTFGDEQETMHLRSPSQAASRQEL
jgi:hypothetical protein